jgi:hypothetical protein
VLQATLQGANLWRQWQRSVANLEDYAEQQVNAEEDEEQEEDLVAHQQHGEVYTRD